MTATREDLLQAECDKAIVVALLDYDAAKRAFTIAKKMSQSDLEKTTREGFLSSAEDAMQRAAVRRAEAALATIRKIIETPG